MSFMNVPVIDMQATGTNIKNLRKERSLKVSDIQNYFDFNTPQAIYKWERGYSLPTIENIVALSRLFRCTVEEIVILKGENL